MSLLAATRLHARLQWTILRRRRLLWVLLALVVLPVVGAVVLRLQGEWGPGLFAGLAELHLGFLIPFVPALLCASAIGEEIERKTFTYVFARPAPRAAMVLGKWAVGVLAPAFLGAVTIPLCWIVALSKFPSDMAANLGSLARVEVALTTGWLLYGALAMAIGVLLTRHPFISFVGYFLLIELGMGAVPSFVHALSMSWHLRNFARLERSSSLFAEVPISPMTSLVVVLGVTTALLVSACALVKHAEYRTDR